MPPHLIIQCSTHRQPVHKLCHWNHQGTDTEGCLIQSSPCSFLHWDKDRWLEWKNGEYAHTMGTCTNRHLTKLPDFPHHISWTYVRMYVCPHSRYVPMFCLTTNTVNWTVSHRSDIYIVLHTACMHIQLHVTHIHIHSHACITTDQHTLILTNIAVWSKVAGRAAAAPKQRTEAFATV